MQYQSVYDLIRRALPGKESCFLLHQMQIARTQYCFLRGVCSGSFCGNKEAPPGRNPWWDFLVASEYSTIYSSSSNPFSSASCSSFGAGTLNASASRQSSTSVTDRVPCSICEIAFLCTSHPSSWIRPASSFCEILIDLRKEDTKLPTIFRFLFDNFIFAILKSPLSLIL